MSADLLEALDHPLFPEVDLHLRAGGHLDARDLARFAYLRDHEAALAAFYARYRCDLVRSTHDFYYLRPHGDRLRQRKLTAAEMYVGMTLCLFYLDPGIRAGTGTVSEDQLLDRISTLLGRERLTRTLQQRKRENAIAEEAQNRSKLHTALQSLVRLGFVERSGGLIGLRPSLMRFADPVHGHADLAKALEELIRTGDVVRPVPEGTDDNGVGQSLENEQHELESHEGADGEEGT
jgi:chromosome partition protein MukE